MVRCEENCYKPYNGFRPPYGDGTDWVAYNCHFNEFSPPYGDGTEYVEGKVESYTFSPPYGDGTGSLQCSIRKEKVFAPLRGWYFGKSVNASEGLGFRPLTGMVRRLQSSKVTSFRFRPLTGRTLSVTAYAVPAPPKGGAWYRVMAAAKAPPFGGAGAQRLRGFCGEKLKSGTKTLMAWQRSFCPLTGMVRLCESWWPALVCFRPLTGMVH